MWSVEERVKEQLLGSVDHPNSQEALRSFLSKLTTTVDFDNANAKEVLKERVRGILNGMAENEEFAEEALDMMKERLANCDDRAALSLNMIECRYKAMCGSGTLEERAKIAIGLERINQLVQISAQKVGELRFVDDVEVHLFYQLMLKERLELPIGIQDMRFATLAGVKREDLEAAENRVQAHTSSPEQKIRILMEQSVWKKGVRSEYPQEFEEIYSHFDQRLDWIEENLSSDSKSYTETMKQVRQDREKAINRKIETLTRGWVNTHDSSS